MRSICLVIGLAWLVSPASAEFHPEARRAHEEHWRGHPEHPDRPVQLWHERFFHCAPPGAWLGRRVDELKRGIAPEIAVAEILASPEYWVRCGGKLETFVQTMFLDVVGRPPSPQEYDFWLRRFYHEDRGRVTQDLIARYPPAWIARKRPRPCPPTNTRAPIVGYRR